MTRTSSDPVGPINVTLAGGRSRPADPIGNVRAARSSRLTKFVYVPSIALTPYGDASTSPTVGTRGTLASTMAYLVIGPGIDRGIVFQAYSLFPWRTVTGNLEYGLAVAKMPKPQRRDWIAELLDILNLEPSADRLPRELSGGMRQRVAIGRALAPEPDVLLLDEPFAALDAQTRRSMQDFLHGVWRRTRCTIVMVTHDVEAAIYLSSRICVMSAGPGRIANEVTVPSASDLAASCGTRGSSTSVRNRRRWWRDGRSAPGEPGRGLGVGQRDEGP